MRREGAIGKRMLFGALSELLNSELEAVSDYLYCCVLCEEEYPELSSFFEVAGQEHADNMKKLGGLMLSLGYQPFVNCRINKGGAVSAKNETRVCALIKALFSSEKKYREAYGKLASLDEISELDAIKEILRVSDERLAMLERLTCS